MNAIATDAKPATRKVSRKTKAKAKGKAKPRARAKTTDRREPGKKRPGSKTEMIAGMLTRPEGCTTAEVLEATGWPTVSMPQQAKAAGLKLAKEKDGKVTRYRSAA